MNNYFDEEFLDGKALEFADNQDFINKTLIGMILTYKKSYNDFLNSNLKKIKKFLEPFKEPNKKIIMTLQEKKLIKILSFLISGSENLINKNNNIKNDKFNSYIQMNSKELKEWNKTLNYAKNKLKWKKIKEVNNKLQFIITFQKDALIRTDYFKKMLLEIKKEESKRERDYRNYNIFKTLFQSFKPKIDQYVYS